MMTFKDYMENMWGEIPWPYRKPSDGQGGENPNPSRPDRGGGGMMGGPPGGGGGGAPMGAPLGMMKKGMKKKMKK